MKRARLSDLARKLKSYQQTAGNVTVVNAGGGSGEHDHTLSGLDGELLRTQAPWVATDISTAVNNYGVVADSKFLRIDGTVAGATSQAQEFQRGVVAVAVDTITPQLTLRSARAAISTGGMLGGIDFQSNDTSLTAPGSVVASIKAVATTAHTATQLGTDIVLNATTGTTTSEIMRVGGSGLVTVPKILTAGWVKDSVIGIGGQGANDLGMLGLYDRNELNNADLRGTVSINITGAGTVTASTVNNAFNARGGFLTITGTDSTTTQIVIHIDLLSNQPNYAAANWQPFLQYRLSMNGVFTHYRTIVCEVSADNTNWYKPTAGQWETTTAHTSELVPGLWMGKNGNPSIPGAVYRYVRFTLTNRYEDAAYASKANVWISQIGLRHYAAQYSRAYMHTSGDTMYGALVVKADSATVFNIQSKSGASVLAVNTVTPAVTVTGSASISQSLAVAGSATIGQSLSATVSLISPLLTNTGDLTIAGANTSLLPTGDLTLNPGGNIVIPVEQTIKTPSFNSSFPIAGFQFNENPSAVGSSVLTIGKVVANELTVDIFTANETRIERGNQYWSKGYAILAANFTTPSAIGNSTVAVFENSPLIPGSLFTVGDWVFLQQVDLDTGIVIETIWGQVYSSLVPPLDPDTQTWTFTLRSGPTNKLIKKGRIATNFGASGQAVIHLSTVDATGSPYIRFRKWSGADPISPSNYSTFTQIGEIGNLFGTTGEYGLYAGNGVAANDKFLKLTDDPSFNNIPINMTSGGVTKVRVDATNGLDLLLPGAELQPQAISWRQTLGSGNPVARLDAFASGDSTSLIIESKAIAANPAGAIVARAYNSTALKSAEISLIAPATGNSTIFLNANEVNVGSGGFGVSSQINLNADTTAYGNVGVGITPTATLDVIRGTATNGTALFRGTQYNSHINHSVAEDTYIRGGKEGSNIYLADVGSGSVMAISNRIQFRRDDNATNFWIREDGANTVISTKVGDMYYGYNGRSGLAHKFYPGGTTEWFRIDNAGVLTPSISVSNSYRLTSGVSIGSITSDYTPTTSNWLTTGTTLLLNANDYSTIGFHDAGNRVDYIRVGVGVITLGYDGGYGAARVDFGGVIGTAWAGVSFGSGWGNYGSGWMDVQYKKIGDMVVLNGLARRSSGTGTLIFTLPTGFRPIANVMVSATSYILGTGHALGRADIYPDGTCVFQTGGTEFFPFFNVTFRAA